MEKRLTRSTSKGALPEAKKLKNEEKKEGEDEAGVKKTTTTTTTTKEVKKHMHKRIDDVKDFDKVVGEIEKECDNVFIIMFGSEDPVSGESWCPDCVIADPVIRSEAKKIDGSILLECPVGQRSEYKNIPDHPYRLHPHLRLKSVPTLVHWGDSYLSFDFSLSLSFFPRV